MILTYNLGTNVLSDPSRDYSTTRLYVGTTGGKLYSFLPMANPVGTPE